MIAARLMVSPGKTTISQVYSARELVSNKDLMSVSSGSEPEEVPDERDY
jgi:hypothetical protein